jgi:hypothetical protein
METDGQARQAAAWDWPRSAAGRLDCAAISREMREFHAAGPMLNPESLGIPSISCSLRVGILLAKLLKSANCLGIPVVQHSAKGLA